MMMAAPLALLLGSTALAQTAETTVAPTGADTMTYGMEWPDAIRGAFYADADAKTLRSQDEMAQSWAGLTQPERDMVTAECARFAQDANANGPTGTEVGGDSGAMEGTGSTTDPAMTEGAATDGMAADTTPEGGTATDGALAPDATTGNTATGDMAANGAVDQGSDGTIGETAPATGGTTGDTATGTVDTTNTTDMADAPAGDAATGMAADGAAKPGFQIVDMIALCPMVENL